MAYDESAVLRIRNAFSARSDISEKKMFGGVAFMHRGNMCVGISGNRLMARVGPDAYQESLARPHAAPMDFTGRPMRGFVFVAAEGYANDDDLREWIAICENFTATLPAK